jgi:Rrf2 family protein
MKITREIDYALRIMSQLAAIDRTKVINGINAASISANISVSFKFTLKILSKLKSGGLVRSFKGAGGGYELTKKPSEINLLDIIEAVDGPIAINNCLDENCNCSRTDYDKNSCFYHQIFDGINEIIAGKLRDITLDKAVNQTEDEKNTG